MLTSQIATAIWLCDCQRRGGNRDTADKKEYISDRIRESVDIFGNQPERLGAVLMNAVAVLAMLISKVLQRARELSAKLSDTEQIPPKPVMSAEAAAYPKLFKIYKELKRQNEVIFGAEKERNVWELERDDLKGLARFTKKGELQSKIDRKNEEIDILKTGLSGIIKRYGYQNVQKFYQAYQNAKKAYANYQDKVTKWKENYENKPKSDSVYKRIHNYQKEVAERQSDKTTQGKAKGRDNRPSCMLSVMTSWLI